MSEAAENAAKRLILITPLLEDAAAFAPVLGEACRAAPIAAVIARSNATGEAALTQFRALATPVQSSGAALLLSEQNDLVSVAGADGAFFPSLPLLQAAMPSLAPGRIAGVGGLVTRHDSMVAAEAGVDFVLFGEPDAEGKRPGFSALVERVSWWAEIFQTSCCAYAGNLDEASLLLNARADFIAFGEMLWTAPEGPAAIIARAAGLARVREHA
ncbi:MAG: thiamine phosphate synthase [Xanthobacteraceae bacterium]|nr:thiamine phosphate synthase [Xanthobacteraceae bacterium]QYK44561.1 MAG: thiamine phosphate synthase [Xanthobacteraceae bacterium]